MEAFETWVYAGIRYVAVPNGRESSSVIAQTGEHYGSWQDVAEFRRRQKQGCDEALVLGRAELRVVHISNTEALRSPASGDKQEPLVGSSTP